jgi:glycosyltransferase involved in cell wall biosynthesis
MAALIINIVSVFNTSGYGKHSTNFALKLIELCGAEHEVRFISSADQISLERFLDATPDGFQITIFFLGTFNLKLSQMARLAGPKIGWVVFETTHFPPTWLTLWDFFDECWVPSSWGRDLMIGAGIRPDKVFVVPEGVDPGLYYPGDKAHQGLNFLSVGKFEGRKSTLEIVSAFREAFPNPAQPLRLWLKASNAQVPDRMALLRAIISTDPRIRLIEQGLGEGDMAELYAQADIFVFPSKAEGWGLPCLEAIASGLPVLATDYSGQGAYLSAIQGLFYPIDYDLAPIEDPDFDHFYQAEFNGRDYGIWAIPSHQSLVQGMREVAADIDTWRDKARLASAIVRDKFNWAASARLALDRLTTWFGRQD